MNQTRPGSLSLGEIMKRRGEPATPCESPQSAAPAAQAVPSPREPAEPRVRAHLVISRGPDAGTGFAISAPRITFGRGRECDVVVDDVTVSRHHAELRQRDGRYILEDGGSLNGTYINRRPVRRAELTDGDEISVGKVRFTFRASAS